MAGPAQTPSWRHHVGLMQEAERSCGRRGACSQAAEKSQRAEHWALFCFYFLNHYFHFSVAPFACSHAPARCSFRALFIKKQKSNCKADGEFFFIFYFFLCIEVKSDLWLGKTIGDNLSLTFTRAVISGLFILTECCRAHSKVSPIRNVKWT